MNKNTAFTICACNYLDKASVVKATFLKHHPDFDFQIILVDKPMKTTPFETPFTWAADLRIPQFLQMAFKYDVIELCTAIKPFVFNALLLKSDIVIYLDPDIMVFNRLSPVIDALADGTTDITLTPHTTTPYADLQRPNDRDLLKFGCYNLGFIAARSSENAKMIMRWWSERLHENCFYDPTDSLAVDQKWMDLVPGFFTGVRVLRDPGLNLAFWNLHERTIEVASEGLLVNNSYPLRFIHFSSFPEDDPSLIARKQSRFKRGDRADFVRLALEYKREIDQFKSKHPITSQYSYDFFDDGRKISPLLRRLSAVEGCLPSSDNPFSVDSAAYRYAIKHRLFLANSQRSKLGFGQLENNKKADGVIRYAFGIALKILGPTRYWNFMRYLSHMSIIRNQARVAKP
jgi:hypothetical protein